MITWVASILCLVGNQILIKKKVWWSFIILGIANIIFTIHWFTVHEWAVMMLTSVFLIQNIQGIVLWRKNYNEPFGV